MKRLIFHAFVATALVAATLAIWHWRFIAVPDALPPNKLSSPLIGWASKPYQTHQVLNENGAPLLRLEKKSPKDKTAAVGMWLGSLEGVRFVRIRCDSRRQNVVLGANQWNYARFVIVMRDENGGVRHPPDSVIFAGDGDSGWETDEIILELTGDMADTGLQIAMLGKTGTLEIRNLSVVAVKQRAWVPAVTAATLLGWLLLCASLIRWPSRQPAWWRTATAATIVVLASWITVFPQTKTILRAPVGGFAVGSLPTPPPPPKPAPAVQPIPKPAKPTPPPVAAKPPVRPTPPAAKTAPEPARRQSGTTHKAIRATDKKFGLFHIATYAGFTFLILLTTGQRHQWPLPLAVAILSELVPALHDHIGDWNDWTDLLQNVAGVALAVACWPLWTRLTAKTSPIADQID